MEPRLSALLVQDRAVSFGQMDEAVRRCRDTGLALADVLLELGLVDEKRLLEALSRLHGDMMPLPLDVLRACDEAVVSALVPADDASPTPPTMIALQATTDGILVATAGEPGVSGMQVVRDRLAGEPLARLVLPFRLAQIAAALHGTPIPDSQQGLARRYPLDVRVRRAAISTETEASARSRSRESDGPWQPGELDKAFAAGLTRDEIIENTLTLIEKLGPRRAVLVPSSSGLRAAMCAGFDHPQPLAEFAGEFQPTPWVQAGLQTDAAVRASIAELGLTDWYGFVDGDLPRDILLAPVTLRGRMILLLLVDSGSDEPLSTERTPWLSVAAHRMAMALGVLIAMAKGSAGRSEQPSTETASAQETSAAEIPPPVAAGSTSDGVDDAPLRDTIQVPRTSQGSRPSLPLDGWDDSMLPVTLKRSVDQKPIQIDFDGAAGSRQTTELPVVTDYVAGPSAGSDIAQRIATKVGALNGVQASSPRRAELHPVTDVVTAVGSPSEPLTGPPARDAEGAHPGGAEEELGSDSSSSEELVFSITNFPAMDMPGSAAVTAAASEFTESARVERRDRIERSGAVDAPNPDPTGEVPSVDGDGKASEDFDPRISTVPRIEYTSELTDAFTPSGTRLVRVSQTSRPHAVALDIEASGVLLDKTQTMQPSSESGYRSQADELAPDELLQWLTSDVTGEREAAFATLLDRGEAAHPLLLSWFPRPLHGERREMVAEGKLLEDHGPVVWLCALRAQAMASELRRFLQNPDSDCRYYALQVLHRVNDEHSVRDVAVLLFDPDDQIRRGARLFLDTFRTQPSFQAMLRTVRRGLGYADERIQRLALDYAAEFADAGSVPGVIGLLDSADLHVSERAEQVLRFLTFQPFGRDVRAWERWQRQTMGTRRERWLLDAMVDRDRRVRENAAAMIDAIPRLLVNYTADMDRQGQLAAQRKVEQFLRDRPGLV